MSKVRLTRCDHCRRACFYPGAKPRAHTEWSDWNRLCPACALADSFACYEAERYVAAVEDSFIHSGVDFSSSAYWSVFNEVEGTEDYEDWQKDNAECVKTHVLQRFQEDVSTFRTYDFSRPKVWSWNGG